MKIKNVALLVRGDFFSKKGGDTVQIENYKKYAKLINYEIITLENIEKIKKNKYDWYVLTNIDRCYDYLEFYKKIKSINDEKKIIVLPIHHSFDSIKEFKKHTKKIYIKNQLLEEKIKSIIRSIKDRKIIRAINHGFFINYRKSIMESLKKSKKIILIANGEGKNLSKDFQIEEKQIEEKSIIIRNGTSQTNHEEKKEHSKKDREIDVLICGRIEPRKNQLNIAKIFEKNKKLKILFLGKINGNFKKYGKSFNEIIEKNKNMTHVDECKQEDVVKYYENSKCHLSASWFEVSSLVDIEAYDNGCQVISSKNGHSNEIINGDGFYILNPSKIEEIEEIVEKAIKNSEKNQSIRKLSTHSWEKASQLLEESILNIKVEL